MPDQSIPDLPLSHFRLHFKAARNPHMPEYSGSAWRGVFGRELRRALCVTHLTHCQPCPLFQNCGYVYIFETPPARDAQKLTQAPHAPHPYVLAPAPRQYAAEQSLDLILIGHAHRHLPYVMHAIRRTGMHGLGRLAEPLILADVLQQSAPGQGEWLKVYDAESGELHAFSPHSPAIPPVPSAVRVEISTPLRAMVLERAATPRNFQFAAFFKTLLRRISLLTYFHSDTPLAADFAGLNHLSEELALSNPQFHWWDWSRHSLRQRQKIPMGGIYGSFELHGGLAPFWPFLWLGQWTRLGKGACMGLGSYQMFPLREAE